MPTDRLPLPRSARRAALATLLMLAPTGVQAIERTPDADSAALFALCPPPPPPALLSTPRPSAPGTSEISADRASQQGDIITLEGAVEITRERSHAGAEQVRIDRTAEAAELRERVFLTTEEILLEAEHGRLEFASGTFDFRHARYHERTLGAQGEAERIDRDREEVTRLHAATFSTCPRFREDWHLSAGRVDLDPRTRQGTARHVSLRFFGLPLFYTPWLRFPLGDERMSGFLAPRIGRSSASGIAIETPWYWNVAAHFDATLTPVYLERRGAQFKSQWRWLNRQGEWQLDHEILPDDRQFGDDRMLTQVQHEGRLGRNWTTRLDISSASDARYFDDLGDDLDLTSRTHLLRRAEIGWRSGSTRLRARAQTYQTLDETLPGNRRPYEQLPQLLLRSHDHRAGPFAFDLDAEAVRWDRLDSTTGTRLRTTPAIRAPLERPGGFLRPRLALDATHYDLDRGAAEPGRDSIQRTLPISSVDAGLHFERPAGRLRQTLEPRLFYVHVPSTEQDDIPLFDTAEFDFNFGQLFRERRFAGGDRIGDSNRLTLALTSRLLDPSDGREVLRGSLGGIRHFADREVGLSAGDPAVRSSSDLLAEIAFAPTAAWQTEATLQWDPEYEEVRRVGTRLGFRGARGGVGNLGWRARRLESGEMTQNQIDASFAWPINPRWSLLGRANRSLESERNLELLGGVEYRSCCWSLRGIAREYISERGEETATSISLELVFRGLGGVGDDAGGIFERAILGYRDRQ